MAFDTRTTIEDGVTSTLVCTLAELDAHLVENVKVIVAPLLVLFDFFVLGDDVYSDIVDEFVAGRVT